MAKVRNHLGRDAPEPVRAVFTRAKKSQAIDKLGLDYLCLKCLSHLRSFMKLLPTHGPASPPEDILPRPAANVHDNTGIGRFTTAPRALKPAVVPPKHPHGSVPKPRTALAS